MTPEFDSDVTEYSATTENATNKVTAVATDPQDIVTIKLGDTVIESGSSATWAEGENTLTIKVEDPNSDPKRTGTYTVTVTKTTPEPEEQDPGEGVGG